MNIEKITIDDVPFMADNPLFRKLAAIEDITALSKEDRDKYDESIKVMRDNLACYHTALKEGYAEGYAESRAESRAMVIRNMLDAGLPLSTISRCTGLSEEEIMNGIDRTGDNC